jgi:integrase/recombinase XerD
MTDKTNAQFNKYNERIKYKYRQHLRRVSQKDEKTVLAELKHIRDFEIFINFAGFETFNEHVADKYIQGMFNANKSLSYISDNVRILKDFLRWLERQRGYRSKIDYNQIDYLNISRNQRSTAKAVEYQKAYKFTEIIKTIRQVPDKSEKNKRDRALISLQALCALRIGELRTVKIKSLIEEDGLYFIYVCPKDMCVKFAKTRCANFMPLPGDIVDNVISWRDYLLSLGLKGADPLFPKVDNRFTQENLVAQSIRNEEIKPDTTIRDIFKKAFENAGYEYIKPHSFRKTLARYAESQSPAFLNAVRQNLGHSSIDTTLSSYGQLSMAEQRNNIASVKFEEKG